VITGCTAKQSAPARQVKTEHPASQQGRTQPISELREPDRSLVLPLNFAHRTGDLDEMIKERNIRALVVYSQTGFFYDKGRPRGIFYEALEEFQKFVNVRFKTGKRPINITFLPVRPDQLESGLTQGLADIIATGIIVTPERAQRVAFSALIESDVKLIVVTGPNFGPLTSLDELSGKVIYANPLTVAYERLEQLSATIKKSGKAPIQIKAADKTLMDEDLLEM
jgi:membrane-bound lytic murein transglycosylase MltF